MQRLIFLFRSMEKSLSTHFTHTLLLRLGACLLLMRLKPRRYVLFFGNTENSGGNGGSGGTPDYDLNDAERCRKEGYTLTSCAAGETPEGFCIYNSAYFARCVCPSGYKTCEPPYYGVGQACGNKYASCEEDTERACKELDSEFTDTCQNGWKVDPNNACQYDKTFGKCCNLCEGYDYTTIPEGYIANGAACIDCNGTSKYKIKINPCDGFQDCGVMGGDTGAKTCMSGSQIKYDNCKPCPNLGTLSSCPSPFKCTYEACSNRYYKSGCQSGYTWNASNKTCTQQCASSYKYTCTGSYEYPLGSSCGGKYSYCGCSGNYEWNGSYCENSSGSITSCYMVGCTFDGDTATFLHSAYVCSLCPDKVINQSFGVDGLPWGSESECDQTFNVWTSHWYFCRGSCTAYDCQ